MIANFTWMRGIRIVVGILLLIQAFIIKEPLYALIAAFFLFTGLANVSSCGNGGSCNINSRKEHSAKKIQMKDWIINNKLYLIGAISGILGGFIYWKYVGCLNGTCSITSDPLNSMLYFALLGTLVFGIFKKSSIQKPNNK